MTDFNEAQLAALATLTLAYPVGVMVKEDDVEACESLVASGHVVPIEGEDFEGRGYQLSPEMAEANRRVLEEHADAADLN